MDARRHPVDTLLDDHRLIKAVLGALEKEAAALEQGAELRLWFWIRAAEFLETFSDRCHHQKEEDLLLPYVLAAGRSPDVAPAAELKHEHIEGRAIKRCLQDATRDIDARGITAAARAYCGMLRRHIEQEEQTVFETARDMLGPRQVATLRDEFDRVEAHVLGNDGRRVFESIAHDLCAEAGSPLP